MSKVGTPKTKPHLQAPVNWGHLDMVPTLPSILTTGQPSNWELWKSGLTSLSWTSF